MIRAVLRELGVRDSPRRVRSGSSNDHWMCGPFVLRRYAVYRSVSSIAWEHDLLRALADLAWVVAVPVATITHDGRIFALFPKLVGRRSPPHTNPFGGGQLLALFHRAVDDLAIEQRPTFTDLLDLEQRCVYWHETERRGLPELLAGIDGPLAAEVTDELTRAQAAIASIGLEGLARCVVHGDWYGGNLLFRDGGLSGVLDFDFAHLDYRVVDIAIAENFLLAQDALVAGYESVTQLDDREIQLIRPILRAFHLHHIGKYIAEGRLQSIGGALRRVRFFY